MKYLLILILTINTTFAQEAVHVSVGTEAPFSGILLTEERAAKAMKAEKANIVLSDLRIAEKELTEYHRDDARRSRTELSKSQIKGNLKLIGGFLLGVIVTGFAFKVNQKIGEI